MTRSNPIQPAFNAGELSPRLAARTDFSKFAAGLETGQNLIALPEGGVIRRPGTRYAATAADSSVSGRLRPFKQSNAQAYILELGDAKMRFYRNQGQIVAEDIATVVTNGTFTSNITGWDDRSSGGLAAIAHDATNGRLSLDPDGTNTGWAEQALTVAAGDQAKEHVLAFRVIGAPGDHIFFRVGSTSTGAELVADTKCAVGWHLKAFTPGTGTVYIQFRNIGSNNNFVASLDKILQIDDVALLDNAAIEITTPWVEADLPLINGPQSIDVKYFHHEDYPSYKLVRYGNSAWSLIEVAWEDGPWLPENSTATTLTFGAATGAGVTVTASAVTGINDDEGFKTTDVGRAIRLTDNTTLNWGWAVIVGWTSTTVVTADVRRTVVVTTAETKWRLGSFSGTTGYPRCGAFYEQRTAVAGSTEQPQTFWMSQTGDFENMAPDSPNSNGTTWAGTVEDDDALDYTISSDDADTILALSPGEDAMAIFTTGGEWVPSSNGIVLTPSDIVVRRQTKNGSSAVQPVRIDNVALHLHRAGRKLLEFSFAFETNGYRDLDMTRLAEHITRGKITEMDYAQEPNDLIYAVRSDGTLLTMTYRREEDVVGWTRHVIGGSFGSGQAVVESVAVIPGNDGAGQVEDSSHRDEVWILVKRTINGATKRYVELLEEDFEGPLPNDYATTALWRTAMRTAQKSSYYADSLITYDGSATDTITGLDHIEGETVKVLADGAVHPDRTVASGSITLDAEYSIVQIGLAYAHKFKTLRVEGGTAAGTAVGKTKRRLRITYVVSNAMTLSSGPSFDDLSDYDFREVTDEMDNAVPLYSGEIRRDWGQGWTRDTRICISNDDPVPFGLLALAPEQVVNEVL